PDASNHAANGIPHPGIRWMTLAEMKNSHARHAVHEVVENLFSPGRNSGITESFFNKRNNHRDGLRPADPWIFELARVHLHSIVRRFVECGSYTTKPRRSSMRDPLPQAAGCQLNFLVFH